MHDHRSITCARITPALVCPSGVPKELFFLAAAYFPEANGTLLRGFLRRTILEQFALQVKDVQAHDDALAHAAEIICHYDDMDDK